MALADMEQADESDDESSGILQYKQLLHRQLN